MTTTRDETLREIKFIPIADQMSLKTNLTDIITGQLTFVSGPIVSRMSSLFASEKHIKADLAGTGRHTAAFVDVVDDSDEPLP